MARILPVSFLTLGILLFQPAAAAPPATVQAHCRTLPSDGLMAKAIEVLLDHQYVIQSANENLGLISFTKVVQSGGYLGKHVVRIGGSMVFGPRQAGPVVARMLIHQDWMDLMADKVTGLGAETDTDEGYYRDIFDDLQQRLERTKP